MLLWGNQSKYLLVFMNSGAYESFMDATLASELDIPTQPLSIHMDVRVFDGHSIGRATHNTISINLRVSGNKARHSSSCSLSLLAPATTIPSLTGLPVQSWAGAYSATPIA